MEGWVQEVTFIKHIPGLFNFLFETPLKSTYLSLSALKILPQASQV